MATFDAMLLAQRTQERDRAARVAEGIVGALRRIVGVDGEMSVTPGQLIERVEALLTGFSMGVTDVVARDKRIKELELEVAALRAYLTAKDMPPSVILTTSPEKLS